MRMIKSSNNSFPHILNLLKKSEIDHDFFELLASRAVPLMRLSFPNLIKQWEREQTKYSQLQKKVQEEGYAALAHLLADSQKNRPLEKQHTVHCLEPYYCLDKLLNEQLGLGDFDTIKRYVEIENYEESEHLRSCFECRYGRNDKLVSRIIEEQGQNFVCPKCYSTLFQVRLYTTTRTKLKYNSYTNSHSYTFPSSIIELVDLYHEYDLDNVQEPWVAWHYLTLVEESWKNLRDYFKKKKLLREKIAKKRKRWPNWLPTSKIIQSALERDGKLLGEHCFRAEMRAIQNKNHGSDLIVFSEETGKFMPIRAKKVHLFERKRFENYLNIVLGAIMGNPSEIGNIPAPSAIELAIEDEIHLRLLVKWDLEITEVFHLHSFHDDVEKTVKNIPRNFITALLDNSGTSTKVPYSNEAKKAIVYLQRAGITGILDELFIAKKTETSATLRSKKYSLKQVNGKQIERLQKHLLKLKSIEWRGGNPSKIIKIFAP